MHVLEHTPHLTKLAFNPQYSENWGTALNTVPAAMAALPLRHVVLQGADLPDLPAGRWLDGARLGRLSAGAAKARRSSAATKCTERQHYDPFLWPCRA